MNREVICIIGYLSEHEEDACGEGQIYQVDHVEYCNGNSFVVFKTGEKIETRAFQVCFK